MRVFQSLAAVVSVLAGALVAGVLALALPKAVQPAGRGVRVDIAGVREQQLAVGLVPPI